MRRKLRDEDCRDPETLVEEGSKMPQWSSVFPGLLWRTRAAWRPKSLVSAPPPSCKLMLRPQWFSLGGGGAPGRCLAPTAPPCEQRWGETLGVPTLAGDGSVSSRVERWYAFNSKKMEDSFEKCSRASDPC